VCGVRLGRYAFVGAGSVVARNVPAFALVYGNPARQHGWLSAHGEKLAFDNAGRATCPATGQAYQLSPDQKTVSIMSEEVSSLTANS
jgi:UDP-2-acetamido-3-amino-2,3-dideoxy-glucuronate N-acetyltransferase